MMIKQIFFCKIRIFDIASFLNHAHNNNIHVYQLRKVSEYTYTFKTPSSSYKKIIKYYNNIQIIKKEGIISIIISLLKYKRGYYKGFINDENGKDIIYTVENIGAMSDEEYNNNKKVLNAQIKKIGLPSNHDLRRPTSNGDVYVHSYTKGDGTYVTSHYRSRPN